MKQVENFKAKQERLKRKLTSSLAYPAIMIATLFFTGLVFVFFIIPEFAVMYEEMNRELPLISQIADQFEESINSKVEIFLAIIEPLMTLFVAIFVVLMILAMALPMMQSSNMIL